MSTKEFFLHSKTVAQGRDAITNFITAYLPSAPQHFPAAAPGLLNGFLASCELNAENWIKYADGGRSHSDMIFNEAVSASSWATVASEIAVELHWVSRLDYACEEQEKSVATPEMRSFARDVNRLLNVMHNLATNLRDSDQADSQSRPADQLALELRQRLQQALYLSELGVKVTCPANYSYHHPEAHKWLSLRGSIRRKLSQALIEAAQADEALARQYRGKTRY
jgi:hypothetical protein